MNLRSAYRYLAALGCLCWAPLTPGQSITAELVYAGLTRPTHATAPLGDPSRLFITEYVGTVWILEHGQLKPEPFIDLEAETSAMMGIAFHPDYDNNGRVFVTFMGDKKAHLVEFLVDPNNPDKVDQSTRTELMTPEPLPWVSHAFNAPEFAGDGKLLVPTTGIFPSDPQSLGGLWGKILRFDVDIPAPHIPADNPFVSTQGARPEIWIHGLRQPWAVSMDPSTGDLYVPDIGSNDWEELNYIPAGQGAGWNLGWPCFEGEMFRPGQLGCDDPNMPYSEALRIYEWTGVRCALIGGHVYRGQALPAFQGHYFFADHCSGEIWTLQNASGNVVGLRENKASLQVGVGPTIHFVHNFGRDGLGELYLLDGLGGEVFKLVPTCGEIESYCTPNDNSSGKPALLGAAGNLNLGTNDLRLQGFQLPPDKPGVFFFSAGAMSPMPMAGTLTLCLTPTVARIPVAVFSDSAGEFSHSLDMNSILPSAPFMAGETWYFQFFYRDDNPGPVLESSNGLRISFCP